MDPTIGSWLQGASGVINALKPSNATAPTSERADGYALGATADMAQQSGATGGATGGAYGGAWGQGGIDGSNWIVNFGNGTTSGGTSGGLGGMSPAQSNTGAGGVQPQSPFSFVSPTNAASAQPATQLAAGSGGIMLVGLALLAYVMVKR